MRQVEMENKTFCKATIKEIAKLLPNAKSYKRTIAQYAKNYLIKDENNKTIATWSLGSCRNGLLVIW